MARPGVGGQIVACLLSLVLAPSSAHHHHLQYLL